MIMIGPGTGLAPFRGFLQERAALKQRGVPVGESLLFFGCRDPLQDFLYEEELRAFEASGITRLHCAFSRAPGQEKVYVQQAIRAQGDEVWRLLQQEAVIFVCGDASRMAPDVRRAFGELFQERTGASGADAQAWSPAWWRPIATWKTSGADRQHRARRTARATTTVPLAGLLERVCF